VIDENKKALEKMAKELEELKRKLNDKK